VLEKLQKEETDKMDAVAAKGELASRYQEENKLARRAGLVKDAGGGERVTASEAMATRVASLEAEVAALKDLIARAGLGGTPAAAGGTGLRAH
jgi:hypothetical protein